MPRDLADVIQYLIPEAGLEPEAPAPRLRRPAALPLVALPIGDRDPVRASLAWNLMVEIARLGGRACMVAPSADAPGGLWPQSGPGPLGTEVRISAANDLGGLHRAALDAAVAGASHAEAGGAVFVRVPPIWLCERGEDREASRLMRWTLLLCSDEPRDALESYGVAKLAREASPSAHIGITVHGARTRESAVRAFERLQRTGRKHLRAEFVSYGMLVDDLHVYRAGVAQRPIGIAQPQSAAARSLRDVAGMLLLDARERAVV